MDICDPLGKESRRGNRGTDQCLLKLLVPVAQGEQTRTSGEGDQGKRMAHVVHNLLDGLVIPLTHGGELAETIRVLLREVLRDRRSRLGHSR